MIERVFRNYDKDGDEKLSAGEMAQIVDPQRRRAIQEADADGDGTVPARNLLLRSRHSWVAVETGVAKADPMLRSAQQ